MRKKQSFLLHEKTEAQRDYHVVNHKFIVEAELDLMSLCLGSQFKVGKRDEFKTEIETGTVVTLVRQ